MNKSSDTRLIDAIRMAAGTHDMQFANVVVCEVTDVNIITRSCTCYPLGGPNSSDLTNVRLMSSVDDGWLLVPAIGSTVVVHYLTRTGPYIALYGAIQKAVLVTLEGIQLQGGELGGLVVGPWLVEQLNIMQDIINELNAKVTTLLAEPVIPVIVDTTVEDISNSFITQGGE